MRWKNKLWVASALTLVACGSFDGIDDGRANARAKAPPPAAPVAEPVKVGDPYQAEGQSYTPKDEVNLDEVGYASWYGDELRGKNTGNGEVFNPDGVSAAHRTLPMPSYVEVTNLDTGRTILVRVNDRGPFAKERVIDLSAGAAKQLGVEGQGHVPVRVRRVNPPEYERTALKNGGKATERLPTPPGLLNALRLKLKDAPAPKTAAKPPEKVAAAKPAAPGVVSKPVPVPPKPVQPKPVPPKPIVAPVSKPGADFPPPGAKPVPVPPQAPMAAPAPHVAKPDDRFVVEETGKPHWRRKQAEAAKPAPAPRAIPVANPSTRASWYVQIGAFSNSASAKSVAAKAGGQAVSAGNLWRVRTGPYESEAAAHRALGGLRAKGYRDARVTH